MINDIALFWGPKNVFVLLLSSIPASFDFNQDNDFNTPFLIVSKLRSNPLYLCSQYPVAAYGFLCLLAPLT